MERELNQQTISFYMGNYEVKNLKTTTKSRADQLLNTPPFNYTRFLWQSYFKGRLSFLNEL